MKTSTPTPTPTSTQHSAQHVTYQLWHRFVVVIHISTQHCSRSMGRGRRRGNSITPRRCCCCHSSSSHPSSSSSSSSSKYIREDVLHPALTPAPHHTTKPPKHVLHRLRHAHAQLLLLTQVGRHALREVDAGATLRAVGAALAVGEPCVYRAHYSHASEQHQYEYDYKKCAKLCVHSRLHTGKTKAPARMRHSPRQCRWKAVLQQATRTSNILKPCSQALKKY